MAHPRSNPLPSDYPKRFYLALFIFIFASTMLFASFRYPGGDARYYYQLTKALVVNRTFDLSDLGFRQRLITGADGGQHTKYPLGQSLVQVPFSLIGHLLFPFGRQISMHEILFLRMTPPFLAAVEAVLLFLLCLNYFRFGGRLSFVLVLIYVFGTQAFHQSKSNFSETLQSISLLGCTYVLLRPPKYWSLGLGSLWFSFLILTKPAMLVAAPAIGYLISRGKIRESGNAKSWAICLLISICFAALLFYYNYIRTGNIFDLGYEDDTLGTAFSLSFLPQNLWNLIAHPQKCVFLFNPVLVLAIIGAFQLGDRKYLTYWTILAVSMAGFFGCFGWNWSGSWGQRYLMPLIPLAIPMVGATLRSVLNQRKYVRTVSLSLIAVLITVSTYISFLGVVYFRYNFKQMCFAYRAHVKGLDLPKCGSQFSNNQVAIYHYMLWNIDFSGMSHESDPELPWVTEKFQPTIASRVFSNERLNQTWLSEDLMFFRKGLVASDSAIRLAKQILLVLLLPLLYLVHSLWSLSRGWSLVLRRFSRFRKPSEPR